MPSQYIDKINLPGNREYDMRDTIEELKDVSLASLASGHVLTFNGTNWENSDIDTGIPDQTNHAREFLTTNGTSVSWAPVPAAITESDVSGWGFTKNTGTLTNVIFNGASASIDGSIASITASIPSTAREVQALSDTTKFASSHSLTIDSSTYVMTSQLKDQDGNNIGASQSIDLPLETMVVGGSYNDSTKRIVLTLKSGSTVDFPVSELVDGLQQEITSSNKLSADLVSDGTTNKVYTSAEKTKLSGIASGAQVNVKPDWNAASGSSAEILNKPTIPTVPAMSTVQMQVTFTDQSTATYNVYIQPSV